MAEIPNTYPDIPPSFTEGSASHAELQAAGFHLGEDLGKDEPGQQPLDEMLVEGEQVIGPDVAAQLLRQSKFLVLRDPQGTIVATWDEGRWWTPEESAEFTRQLVAEMRGEGD
jgi:hypothetical protein